MADIADLKADPETAWIVSSTDLNLWYVLCWFLMVLRLIELTIGWEIIALQCHI
jgi:hypothetical protein